MLLLLHSVTTGHVRGIGSRVRRLLTAAVHLRLLMCTVVAGQVVLLLLLTLLPGSMLLLLLHRPQTVHLRSGHVGLMLLLLLLGLLHVVVGRLLLLLLLVMPIGLLHRHRVAVANVMGRRSTRLVLLLLLLLLRVIPCDSGSCTVRRLSDHSRLGLRSRVHAAHMGLWVVRWNTALCLGRGVGLLGSG